MSSMIAFIGLGTMGFPMAGHLAEAGYQVTVYNRTTTKVDKWLQRYKGSSASTPALAAKGADFIFICVGNDDDLRQVCTGPEGAFSTAGEGAIFIDNTTTSAVVARELAVLAADKGFHFMDAPVSGGQAGAEKGTLTVMMGGDEKAYEKAAPVMAAYAAKTALMGPAGNGQLTKMVNQICIAGLVQALSEGIHFAKCADLDVEAVIDVISKGAAQSWQMENRWATMNRGEFNFGFAVDWMRKDLGIAREEAVKNGASLPVTEIVDEYYSRVQDLGGNRWDTSSLIALLEPRR